MNIAVSFYKFLLTGIVPGEYKKLSISFIFSYLLLKFFLITVFFILKYLFYDSSLLPKREVIEDENIIKFFLNVVVLAPVFEEMICRHHLNFSYRRILISAVFACLLLYDELNYLLIVLIYLAVLVALIWKNINFNKLILVYLSSALFAFLHLIMYPDTLSSQNVINIILVILPHFIGGLLLSYIFIRNGTFAAIILHALWNLLPFASFIFKLIILDEI